MSIPKSIRPLLSRLAIMLVTSAVTLGIPALTVDRPMLSWVGNDILGPRIVSAATAIIEDKLGPPAPEIVVPPTVTPEPPVQPEPMPEPEPEPNVPIIPDVVEQELPDCVKKTIGYARIAGKIALLLLLG